MKKRLKSTRFTTNNTLKYEIILKYRVFVFTSEVFGLWKAILKDFKEETIPWKVKDCDILLHLLAHEISSDSEKLWVQSSSFVYLLKKALKFLSESEKCSISLGLLL